ncbi:MAG: hypothetical protein KJ818_08170, partial [Candidatus Omnitrophica bacterium]|nr:hypothetical protein [Candidatus Omnitrophota bacterium]
IPHPEYRGIWVANKLITYFCDGLNADFYFAKEKFAGTESLKPDDEQAWRVNKLATFQEALKQNLGLALLGSGVACVHHEFRRFIDALFNPEENFRFFYNFNPGTYESKFCLRCLDTVLWDLGFSHNADAVVTVEARISDAENDLERKAVLGMLEDIADIADEVVSFPLYPEIWGNEWIARLKGISCLKDIPEKMKKQEEEGSSGYKMLLERFQAQLPQEKEKFQVLTLHDSHDYQGVSRELDSQNYRLIPTSKYKKAVEALKNERIDLVIFDLVIDSDAADQKFEEEFRQFLCTAPYLIMDTGWSDPAEGGSLAFAQLPAQLAQRVIRCSSDRALLKKIKQYADEKFKAFDDARGASKPKTKAQVQPQPPAKLEKLKILYLDDDSDTPVPNSLKAMLDQGEYELCRAYSYAEATTILTNTDINLIIFDLAIPDYDEDNEACKLFDQKLNAVLKVMVISAAVFSIVDAELTYRGFRGERNVFEKPLAAGEVRNLVLPVIKDARQAQLAEYDKQIAAWRKAHELPQKPEKLRVLYLDDDPDTLSAYEIMWKSKFSQNEYDFSFCHRYSEGLKILREKGADLVILDYSVPCYREETLTAFDKLFAAAPFVKIISGYNDARIKEDLAKEERFTPELIARIEFVRKTISPGDFCNLIPVCRQQQLSEYDRAMAEWKKANEPPQKPEKLRVLVIEDDPNTLEAYRDRFGSELSNTEYDARFAGRYSKAQEEFQSGKFDLIIYDIRVGGLNLIKDQIKQAPHLIIFTATAFDTAKDLLNDDEMFERSQFFDKGVRSLADAVGVIKECRQTQLADFDRAMAEWEKANEPPQKPEKLRALILNDEPPILRYMQRACAKQFSAAEYDCAFAKDYPGALTKLKAQEFDIVLVDFTMPNHEKEASIFFAAIPDSSQFIIYSLETWEDREINEALRHYGCSETLLNRKRVARQETEVDQGWLIKLLQSMREDQLGKFDEDIAKWRLRHPEAARQKPVEQVIFAVQDSSAEAEALAIFLRENLSLGYKVIYLDSVWRTNREMVMEGNIPEVVIFDQVLNGKDATSDILSAVRQHNPDCRFIVTSEEAEITAEELLK